MAFFITIVGGTDDGRVFEIDRPQALVGRSSSADVKLNDDTVSWEHCTVREEDGRFVVENLSSLGTVVRQGKISRATRVSPGEEIELSARCRIRVDATAVEAEDEGSKTPILALVMVIVLLVFGGLAYVGTRSPGPPPWQPSARNWRDGYTTLSRQLDQWSANGQVPAEFPVMFEDAWLTDQSGDYEAAAMKWRMFLYELSTTPAGIVDPSLQGETFRTSVSSIDEAIEPLSAIMGGVQGLAALDAESAEARVKALVGFAEFRKRRADNAIEENED